MTVVQLLHTQAFEAISTIEELYALSDSARGGKLVKVALKDELAEEHFLQQWNKSGDDVGKTGRPISYDSLSYAFKQLKEGLGNPGEQSKMTDFCTL